MQKEALLLLPFGSAAAQDLSAEEALGMFQQGRFCANPSSCLAKAGNEV